MDSPSEGRDEVDRIEDQEEQDAPAASEEIGEDDDRGNADGDADADQLDDSGEVEQLEENAEAEHGDGECHSNTNKSCYNYWIMLIFDHIDTVENVLEPEESDVCLIPDDPETEVTEAEKELARENAEKAAEEEEAAEQIQAASKSPVADVDDALEANNEKGDATGEANASTDEFPRIPNGKHTYSRYL